MARTFSVYGGVQGMSFWVSLVVMFFLRVVRTAADVWSGGELISQKICPYCCFARACLSLCRRGIDVSLCCRLPFVWAAVGWCNALSSAQFGSRCSGV